MKRKIFLKSIALGLVIVIYNANCQIPVTGSDLASLSGLRWGESIQEVKDSVHRDLKEEGDTALTFQDSFLDSNVEVTLKFGQPGAERGLQFVEIQFDGKNVEKLRAYLKSRYGEKYETEKKEKSKLFFTVNLEASKWSLKNEIVVMMVFSQGDQILSLSLLYKRKER